MGWWLSLAKSRSLKVFNSQHKTELLGQYFCFSTLVAKGPCFGHCGLGQILAFYTILRTFPGFSFLLAFTSLFIPFSSSKQRCRSFMQ